MTIRNKLTISSPKISLCFKGNYSSVMKHVALFIAILLMTINHAHAEDPVVDKFRIALGGYSLARYDSSISLTDTNFGAGVSISPEDTLGLKAEQTVMRVDGYYRYDKKNALTFSWYSINSDGYKSVEEEFDWVDENGDAITIPVGANVTSNLGYDIFKIGYLRSFYHSDKVELSAGVGLHLTRVAMDLLSDSTSSGIAARDVSTSIPLPVLSFGLSYNITPKLHWYLKSEAFALRFEDWDGTYTDNTLGIEYRAFKNVGLGVGLGSNSLKVVEKTDQYKFDFDNRISGLLFYAAAYF